MIPLSFLTLILFLFLFLFLFTIPIHSFSNSSQFNPTNTHNLNMPGKRTFSSFSQQEPTNIPSMGSNKKLRRLPHVFSKVLELPFTSDEEVYVEDRHDCLKFVANANVEVVGGGIHVVKVHPGITKVVVRRRGSRAQMTIDELELDVWRFRLPATASPELAFVVYDRGQLVVTVPKNGWGERNAKEGNCKGGFKGNMGGRLITVQ